MNESTQIIEKIKTMSNNELIALTKILDSLNVETKSVLQDELIHREFFEEAMNVGGSVDNSSVIDYKKMTNDEIQRVVDDRLKAGEPLENIKLDLKDNEINVFDFIQDEVKTKQKAFDYISDLRSQGLNESQIDEKLNDSLSIDSENSEVIKSQLRQSGKTNLIIGYTLTIFSLILIIGLLFGGKFSFGGVVILGIGVWRIAKGREQSK